MLNLKQAIQADITQGIKAAFPVFAKASAGRPDFEVVVKKADGVEHGDYASPVALNLAKQLKKKPLEIVEEIVKHMPKKEYIGRVTAAAPGFLNVRLSPGWLTARLDNIVKEEIFTDLTIGKGKSADLEFISANPTGPMTMGNARPAFAADTLANVFAAVGYNVTREYYINDAGEQVRRFGESVVRRILQAQPFDGTQGKGQEVEFPEDLYQGEYVKDLGQQIAEKYKEVDGKEFTLEDLQDEKLIQKVSQEAVALAHAENVRTVAEVLKVNMNVWSSEQAIRDSGAIEKVLEELRKKGVTYKKEGAEWLKTSEFGHNKDVVIVKKDGNYAYFTPDIAYNQDKYHRGYDLIFTFLGADHLDHYPRILAAMKALGNDVGKWHYPIVQFFRLVQDGKEVRLSKRRGNIATPKDLIDEVGYDAARFLFLMHDLKSHMDFDLALAKEKSEKNPVYYVQYAYVRLQSILRKAKEEGVIKETGEVMELTSQAELTHMAEIALMKEIYRLPEVLVDIAQNFTVHQLAYYAHDLATAIHYFYKHVRVLSGEDEQLKHHRLQLVLAARAVLGKTLDLLGISKPDVM